MTRGQVLAGVALVAYLVALGFIAFWPEHIDQGADPLLRAIRRVLPWATPARIEFGANVALFVPLGWLLTHLLAGARYAVLPIGFLVTLVIEGVQGELLPGRTASLLDIVANTAGTCIGILIAAVLLALSRRGRAHRGG